MWQGGAQSCLRGTGYLRGTSPASRRLKSEERGQRRQEGEEEARRKVVVKRPDRKCTQEQGEQEQSWGAAGRPQEAGVLVGPHTGWGRVASSPFHTLRHSPFLAWVSEVGNSLLTVTMYPLGTNSVIESLLGTGSPGGTGVSPLDLENSPAQSHTLGKSPWGQPQITRAHMTP